MADVTFYHQERFDGGQRSGVTVDGRTVLHGFVPGAGEYDPELEWYVDLSLPTTNPPTETDALQWLAVNERVIRDGLVSTAAKLECGLDNSAMPWETTTPGPEGPIRVSVVAVRRLLARQVGDKLRGLAARDWASLFPTTTPVS